jgi:hypothetical protein
MRNDKHLAFKLRKKGLSYNKISKELQISKSTLSNWFSPLDWSQEIKENLQRKAIYVSKKRLRLINKRRKEYWEKWREAFRKEARREFPSLLKDPLFTLGIALYWGEGDHKLENCKVSLINTDPRIIYLFSNFLRKTIKIDPKKIHAWLILYPDLSESKCKSFWAKASGIPLDQFKKTQYIKGRHPTKKSSYGICTVLVFSRGLKEKIFVWKNLFYEMYLRE